ncbi:MAG: hypothetical protein LR001_06900 [Clostridiales bacterium]|nr:hypothetical protein [Clostridiales bacterium]
MKCDRTFLNEMWHLVDVTEREELEKARIRRVNKNLTIKSIAIVIFTIVVFAFLLSYPELIADLIYPLSISTLLIVFFIESRLIQKMEDKNYGNHNISSY